MSARAHHTLIVNELLAFLQQQYEKDEDLAIQICSTKFSVEEICAAKQTLYQSLQISGSFIPHRRDDENGKRSLKDIIKVLKETYSVDVPTFVARDLDKVPSVALDHVNVTSSVLKDIVALKASLAELQAKFDRSEAVIVELRSEVASLRNTGVTSADVVNSAKVVHRHVTTSVTANLQTQQVSPAAPSAHTAPQSAPPTRAPLHVSNPPPRPRPAARGAPAAPPAVPPRTEPKSQPSHPKNQVDKDGFILVQKKSKARRQPRKSQCGTAAPEPNSALCAATPNTPLYVSRLHHSSTATDVVEHVRKRCGYSLRVTTLESAHYVHFKSYVVHVPNLLLVTIAAPDFWPKGVVFRRFRGTLRATDATPTTLKKPGAST